MTGAITALEKAEKLAPQAPRTHFYLSQAYWKTGKTDLSRRRKRPNGIGCMLRRNPRT